MRLLNNITTFFRPSLSNKIFHPARKAMNVPYPKLCSVSVANLSDEYPHELCFATKNGLPLKGFPIRHSSLAFRSLNNNTFAIYGRQSPFDVSTWSQYGFFMHTAIDNEKKYLNEKFSFVVYPTEVSFTKEEINKFLLAADKLINKKPCNMYQSNCYSFSITAMVLATQALLQRPHFESTDAIKIFSIIEPALNEHYSIGILNNRDVVDTLISTLLLFESRIHSLKMPSKNDEKLLGLLTALIKKVELESTQYRLSCVFR